MLATDTDDTFVVLVWNMEGNRCWHLLLNKVETLFNGFIVIGTNIDIKVVLVEAVKNNLDVSYNYRTLVRRIR